MKKKIFSILLITLTTCALMLALTACGGDNSSNHTHSYKTLSSNSSSHWYECSCGEKNGIDSHKGGTATCQDKAFCIVCNEEYGEIGYCSYVNGTCIWCGTTVSEGLEYTLINNESEYEVRGKGTCYDKNIVIPSTYQGLPVTSIGNSAFAYCTSATTIKIPNSVTNIDIAAFGECTSLESIVIPESITSLGELAFYGCTSLSGIKIPNEIKSIGRQTFYNCISLETVELPNSLTSIGYSAFECCGNLTEIVIPDTVTSIGENAFYRCSKVEKITLPFVGAYINGMVDTHFGYLFGADDYNNNQYMVPSSLKTIVITKEDSINEYAFYECVSLTSVELQNEVTEIGSCAFYNCHELKNITLPDSITSIGNSAFAECSYLENIEIPDSVTSIGASAFSGCSKLASIEIPYGIQKIEGETFEHCRSLANVTIPNSVTNIGGEAFVGCWALANINIPNSVTCIDSSAFSGCGLISIIIPNSITWIDAFVFKDCDKLTSIVIPDSVTDIYGMAFYGCCSLRSVYYCGTADKWNEIIIAGENTDLISIRVTNYYFIENENDVPNDYGDYWHYVDGVPTIWEKD